MNGLDKIKDRIAADAQAEAESILAQARTEAGELTAQARAQGERAAQEILEKGEKAARERRERLASMAQMEGRKQLLSAKQEMITAALDKALTDLIGLPEETQIELLANLAARAAVTGREQVMFSEHDQKRIGRQVVAKANEILAKKAAPKLPEEATQGKLGALLESAVNTVSALAKGTAMLTLSDETRPICGGLILESDGVEINCAYETLVRLSRSELELQVAQILFEA